MTRSSSGRFSCIWICVSTRASGASKMTGPEMLPQDARLICPGKKVLTLPRRHLAGGKSPEVTAIRDAGRRPLGSTRTNPFCSGALFHIVIKTPLRVDGAGFVCQGNVANPKAETSDGMLLCPLCNNVTKILMIKSYNLWFRINGFDVCLVLCLHITLQLSTCV